MNRDKITGMLYASAIGDAWGMPVEGFSYEKILENFPYGILCKYENPSNHKWYTSNPYEEGKKTYITAGTPTDDWQLTDATLNALISCGQSFNIKNVMKSISQHHILAYSRTTAGWGTSTREAVKRMVDGVSWQQSGKTEDLLRGMGNGVVMKCSPFAPYKLKYGEKFGDSFNDLLVQFSAMTHYTQMSAYACVLHCEAIQYCLKQTPESFKLDEFWNLVCNEVWEQPLNVKGLVKTEDNLKNQFVKLWDAHKSDELRNWDIHKIIQEFGGGHSYVYYSLPFSYALFYQNWHKGLSCLECVINGGGDTDTNAKMVGDLIGALFGMEHIRTNHKWALDGIRGGYTLSYNISNFCDYLGFMVDPQNQ